jgi:hypothetical protein
MADRLLLALQFWNGDRQQAMRLARTIVANERKFCKQADFLFAARHDADHDPKTIADVSRRFNVFTFKSGRFGTGWPHGCNDLWFATMEWAGSFAPKYGWKAVLTFEADCVPLTDDWIQSLSDEWDRCKKYVVGSMQPHPNQHVNGNALFSCAKPFTEWLTRKLVNVPARHGWDCYLAKSFKQWGWASSPKMLSLYQKPNLGGVEAEELIAKGVTFLHGVKDESGLDYRDAKIRANR